VKCILPLLAALSLIAACGPAAADDVTPVGNIVSRGPFNLAEAYPCTPVSFDAAEGIAAPRVFAGTCSGRVAAGAVPGVLCLRRSGLTLDVNCFATIPRGQTGPCFVQSYRLTKTVPGSYKCPDVYGRPRRTGYRYFQFGAGVRTWWALDFTQPGTSFLLEVTSVCRAASVLQLGSDGQPVLDSNGLPVVLVTGGQPQVHRDRWTWRVVADENTLGWLIELMHQGAVATLEVPCIIGEDLYDALKTARQRLAGAIAGQDIGQIGNAIIDFEALIVSNCLFTEVLDPLTIFRGSDQFGSPNIQPPGNLAPAVLIPGGSTAVAGVIDTTEHPCCCKLLVDLEWIANQNGIVGPNTLDTGDDLGAGDAA
jgi:hypothetical protein